MNDYHFLLGSHREGRGDLVIQVVNQQRLVRRRIRPRAIELIGNEANRIEDVDLGIVHSWDVRSTFPDPAYDVWPSIIQTRLKKKKARELAEQAGVTERAIRAIRNGHSVPSESTKERLLSVL